MKVLLIILITTIAINIISKRIFVSKFVNDIFGTERLKYQLNNKICFSNIVYAISKILIFIELIIISIKLVLLLF